MSCDLRFAIDLATCLPALGRRLWATGCFGCWHSHGTLPHFYQRSTGSSIRHELLLV